MCGSDWAGDNRGMNLSVPLPVMARWRALRVASRLLWVAAVFAAGSMPQAQASGRDDHDRARAAVQAGEVLPLPVVLERLQRTHPGQVLELELERDKGRWIYEIRLMQADGQLLKLKLDAATAQVLEARKR